MSKSVSRKVGETRLMSLFNYMTLDLESLSPHEPAKAYAVERQLLRMKKRAEIDSPALHTKAIEEFKCLNEELFDFSCSLDPRIQQEASDFIRHVLERCVKKLYPESLQECFSLDYVLSNWSFGPGASNGVKGSGTVLKIDQPMTYTKSAEPYVLQIRRDNLYFQCFDALDGNIENRLIYGSRLSTVLKNETSVRTIAIEPSGNMAIQLSGGRLIQDALSYIGLDIRSQQPKNKMLARIGSSDSSVCTLDLSKASDRITPDLVHRLWPAEWFSFFMKTRSPITELPDGTRLSLNMISTMGNGYTFPMMTLTILALVYANRLVSHGGPYRYVDFSQTAVFGDDIIVPTHEFESLCEVLHCAGLVVNIDKSYNAGPFRESCGGDYFEGYDVTPFYVKRLLQTADVYVAINQCLRFCARHTLAMYRTLKYLFSLLHKQAFLVPEWCQDTSGVRTSQCPRLYKQSMPRPVLVPYKGAFEMSLACGGYLEWGNGVSVFQPRSSWVKYRTGISKLPEGYLDGWDPGYWDLQSSRYASLLVSMVS